jgi:hypothetical protein
MMLKKTLLTAAATAVACAGLGLAPGAASAGTYTEHCANGQVVVHTSGNAVWAESGDAKYQLVAIEGSYSGAYLDKNGVLTPYSGTFDKTWTSGKKDVALVCDGSNHESNPTTGEYSDETFRATLRQVQ